MTKQNGRIVDMADALDAAKKLLGDELDAIYETSCPKVNGRPDIDRLDTASKPLVRRYRRVIKKIDEALK